VQFPAVSTYPTGRGIVCECECVGSANVANYLHTHTNTPSRQTRRLHNVPSGTERYIEGPGRITKLPAPNKPQTWTAGRGTNKMRTKSVSCPIGRGEKRGESQGKPGKADGQNWVVYRPYLRLIGFK